MHDLRFGKAMITIVGQVEETSSDYDRKKFQERLAKLVGGVAVVNVFDFVERFHNPRRVRRTEQRKEKEVGLTQPSVNTG